MEIDGIDDNNVREALLLIHCRKHEKRACICMVVAYNDVSSSASVKMTVFRPNRDFSPTGARRLSRERGRMKKMKKNDRQQL